MVHVLCTCSGSIKRLNTFYVYCSVYLVPWLYEGGYLFHCELFGLSLSRARIAIKSSHAPTDIKETMLVNLKLIKICNL